MANDAPRAPGRGEVMIEADHLTRYYGPAPALSDITFRAHRGEVVGFLGPNGAGKTTTMRILTGYMPPSSGRASIAGHDIVEDSMAARRNVGYLPETTPLYLDMTVYGYLDFMARLRGVADRGAAVERAMSRVSIDHRADDLISHLSKGMRQRVGIAQAVLHEPPVIILDEPTIGLDPRQVREVRDLIRELGGDHTLIISTHILSEAQQLCDRVLIINDGRIVAEDAPSRLTQQLEAGKQVRVAIGGDAGGAEAALGAVAGITGVEARGDGVFLVTAAVSDDPRPAIARAVVERGWPLLELTPIALSLEDIFLRLTDEAQVEVADEADDDEEGDDA